MTDTQPADTDAPPLIRLFEGDSLDVLRTIPDHTYTAVVTDPPYGLSAAPDPFDVLAQWLAEGDFVRKGGRKKAPPPGLSEIAARFQSTAGGGGFLGHTWDAFVPGPRLWREVFRTCKPGAIALVFASTRTQHWMALSLVLAGFEILDTIGWVQAQGMAKSGTVDKRIDARAGAKRKRVGTKTYAGQGPESYGSAGTSSRGFGVGESGKEGDFDAKRALTFPVTDEAKAWEGWSTQLGPALEPIIVARKPCEGTAVENVLRYGCGAMNIDACRITNDGPPPVRWATPRNMGYGGGTDQGASETLVTEAGRWPKNVMFSGAAAQVLDAQVGWLHGAGNKNLSRSKFKYGRGSVTFIPAENDRTAVQQYDKGGPASRFFWVGPLATDDDIALPIRYVPKAARRERNAGLPPGVKGDHPTKKPRKLMEWLCRLAGHPKGRILDPFAGSGSTLAAARAMGLPCDGVERDEHYCLDLAAPTAGVDLADVMRVPPPASDAARPLDAAPRVPYYEMVRPPRPPVTFPVVVYPDSGAFAVPDRRPPRVERAAPLPPEVIVDALQDPAHERGETRVVSADRVLRVSYDAPPVPVHEIPAPIHADASYGLPPMFPRLPGAPEVP